MWLYNVLMSGDSACCSVVCGTGGGGVLVFSVLCSELLILSEIS